MTDALIYDSLASAAAATIDAAVKSIETQFHSPVFTDPSSLTGGARYARASLADITASGYPARAYFRSADRFMPDGTVDAVNGGFWLLIEFGAEPEALGARGDGASDDTPALAAFVAFHIASEQKLLRLRSGAAYLVDRFEIPDDMICDGNGARIDRRINQAFPLVDVGKRSIIRNLAVNGRMDVLGSTPGATRMTGIALDDDALAEDCEAYQNARHGISNKNVVDQLEYRGLRIVRCYTHHNGANPSPLGTGNGDGINLTNVSEFLIRDCKSRANGRSDVVVTTFNPATGTVDSTLSSGGLIDNIDPSGAAYVGAEVNFEYCTGVKLINSSMPEASVVFSGTDFVTIQNVTTKSIYSLSGNNPQLLNCRITNAATSASLIDLRGNDIVVRDVAVSSTASNKSGTAVTILPANGRGTVDNLRVDGAYNGIVINCDNFRGLTVTNNANTEIRVGPTGASYNAATVQAPARNSGRTTLSAAVEPSTGTWVRGDEVHESTPTPGVRLGWVCTASGNPGTWVQYT